MALLRSGNVTIIIVKKWEYYRRNFYIVLAMSLLEIANNAGT